MEAQLKLDVVMPKPIKKYSIDLSTFSVRQGLGNLDAEMDKCRRMTYDFSAPPRRATNPLFRDVMFQKINADGIISEVNL